jgi:hypothetical protein
LNIGHQVILKVIFYIITCLVGWWNLPKGIDLNQADQHYLNQVAMSLNTRPRKALDWLTPLGNLLSLLIIIRLLKLSHLMFEFAILYNSKYYKNIMQ